MLSTNAETVTKGNYMMFWRLSRCRGTIDRYSSYLINGQKGTLI